jgi:hypothetical protein
MKSGIVAQKGVIQRDGRKREGGIEDEYPRNNKAPAFLQGLRLIWCRHQESNPGPTDYKSVALPTELYRRVRATIIATEKVL